MTFKGSTILVTGGAGFVGSAVIRHLLGCTDANIVNIDKLTYAASLQSLAAADRSRYVLEQMDICDAAQLRRVFAAYKPDAVMHLAAESHVDRSIDAPNAFVQSNVVGTFTLLQEALHAWRARDAAARGAFRFLHVSTDEVFGSREPEGLSAEDSVYAPNSPYAATKASSDHLVRAWGQTYGLPVMIARCSNNYGPYQFPEKLIPQTILKGLANEPIPVYGDGSNIRDWLYVEDHADALTAILARGAPGEAFNISGRNERTNLDIVEAVCDILDILTPASSGSRRRLISLVEDRPGHDRRYAVDPSKLRNELGWQARESFESGLRKTVQWYVDNPQWWQPILEQGHRMERMGLT